MEKLSNEASKQGELWSRGAREWVAIQEPTGGPLWKAALDAAGVKAGMRMLDAGCGGGGLCALATQRGALSFGVDPSVTMITLARERLPLVDFRIAELEQLPFPNAEFDAALAVNSIQYVAGPQVAMHELGRVCKPGGRAVAVVFSDPEGCDSALILGAILDLFEKPPASRGPFALSAPGTLPELIKSVTGLQCEAESELEYSHEYPDVETALRGQMSAGATWRAVEILGEDRVRGAIRRVLEDLRQPDGTVWMRNRYRMATALRQAP